jgi:pantothenate kinase
MKAGVDFGSTLVKACWQAPDGTIRYASTADMTRESLATALAADGVSVIHATGIGDTDGLEVPGFELRRGPGDPIVREKLHQADGVRDLLNLEDGCPDGFWLVSVGTGTSYTMVAGRTFKPYPMGNPVGGGMLAGLGALLGADTSAELDRLASLGNTLDILYKDRLPDLAGKPLGEHVISHFGKATAASRPEDACTTLIRLVAVQIIRDLLNIGTAFGFEPQGDVVFIGTPISRLSSLKRTLSVYAMGTGMKPHFPGNGEYAAARGAYNAKM